MPRNIALRNTNRTIVITKVSTEEYVINYRWGVRVVAVEYQLPKIIAEVYADIEVQIVAEKLEEAKVEEEFKADIEKLKDILLEKLKKEKTSETAGADDAA